MSNWIKENEIVLISGFTLGAILTIPLAPAKI